MLVRDGGSNLPKRPSFCFYLADWAVISPLCFSMFARAGDMPFRAGSGSLDEVHLKRPVACAYRHEDIEASEMT